VLGCGIAAATIWLGWSRSPVPTAQRDLLSLAVTAWLVGWALAPAIADAALLPARSIAFLGLPRFRVAAGLLAAIIVGVPGAVTALALGALPVFAGRVTGGEVGPLATVAVVPVIGLLLTLAGLLSVLSGRLFSTLSSTRLGAVVAGVVVGLLLVSTQWGWIVLVAIESVWTAGFSEGFSDVVAAMPPSWGVRAAAAVADGNIAGYLGYSTALGALDAMLFAAWSLVAVRPGRRLTVRAARHPAAARRRVDRPRRMLPPAVRSVVRRELLGWARAVTRIQAMAASVVFALATAALPLMFDSHALLPWAGVFAVAMLTATTSNLLAEDGTALWLTIQVPQAVAAEVRGRQLTWSLVAAAVSIPVAVVGLSAGDGDSWPLVATAAMIVAGGGIVGWLGIVALVPVADPRATRDRPLEHGDVFGQSLIALLFIGVVAAGPIALAVITPTPVASVAVAALVVGLAFALAWWLGRLATSRLAERGPELLVMMRSRGVSSAPASRAEDSLAAPVHRRRKVAVRASVTIGMIALFPQAVVPTAMKLSDNVAPVWFLALHLPAEWQWPVIGAMAAIAGASFAVALRLLRRTPSSRPWTPTTDE
jgi:ABC-2 type transport system permease protein